MFFTLFTGRAMKNATASKADGQQLFLPLTMVYKTTTSAASLSHPSETKPLKAVRRFTIVGGFSKQGAGTQRLMMAGKISTTLQ